MRFWLSVFASGLLAVGIAAPGEIQAKEHVVAKDPKIVVVENMIDAWNTRNWQRVIDLFTENGALHSMMLDPVVGRETIGKRIFAMGAGIETITLHILHMGVVGDVVMVERVDDFVYKGHHGKVPVVGVIKIEGDKISEWREYYDRASLVAAMGLTDDFHKPAN